MKKKLEIRVLYNPQQHRFFALASNGMMIGCCINGQMTIGHDPGQLLQRAFIDNDSAVAAAKEHIVFQNAGSEVVFLPEEYRSAPSAPPQMPAPHRSQ